MSDAVLMSEGGLVSVGAGVTQLESNASSSDKAPSLASTSAASFSASFDDRKRHKRCWFILRGDHAIHGEVEQRPLHICLLMGAWLLAIASMCIV